MNTTTNLTALVLLLIILIVYVFLFSKRKFNRHDHNWEKAIKVRKKLLSFTGEAVEARRLGYLRKIDPFVFEELLLYSFHLNGAKVIRNKRYTNDGGIDGKVMDHKGNSLIQAKRYSSHIDLSHVKEFNILIEESNWANHGYFIHTGRTGKGVYETLKGSNITLISGKKLVNFIISN
jgi:restriction system protein